MIAPLPDAVARFRREVERLRVMAPQAAIPGRVALAVSGGPDSMAMLALGAAAFPGAVIAATVDHGLRGDAAAEAVMVADACAALGVPHATLHPAAPIAGSSIQMRARDARYAALAAWMAHEQANVLLTAHHADDQAETLLMRLNRASGLAGLASIRAVRVESGIAILRPLLAWRRAALRALAEDCGVPFVDDPSNADPRHDRARMRAVLATTPMLDPAALAASASYLAEAEAVVADAAARLWAERWSGPERGLVIDDLPRELQRRLVRSAIDATRATLGIEEPPFSVSSNVEPLLDALAERRGATQGGVQIVSSAAGCTFRRAPPRRSV